MRMARTIVVPLIGPVADAERVSEQALPVARALAAQTGSLVVLVSVMVFMDEFGDLPESAIDDPAVIAKRTSERHSYLQGIAETFGDADTHTEVLQGDPADALLSLLPALDNPTVVMASHGHRGLRRMILGSVVFDVVQRATCPVLVVPVSDEVDESAVASEMRRVLIPLDRTPDAEHAVDVAVATVGGQQLSIHLVQVISPLAQRSSRNAERHYSTAKEVANEYLNGIGRLLSAAGHDVSTAVAVGSTEDELVREAGEFGADIIVMATRGRSGIGRFLFGSVTEGLVQIGQCPILVVPPGAAGKAQPHVEIAAQDTGDSTQLALRRARDIMVSPAITATENATLEEVARLMLEHRIGCVPIVDREAGLLGIVTESDFTGVEGAPPFSLYSMPQLFGEWVPRAGIERIYEAGRALHAKQIMSKPVVTAAEDEPVSAIVAKLVRHDVTGMPVVKEGVVIGMVTRHDLLKMLHAATEPGANHGDDARDP